MRGGRQGMMGSGDLSAVRMDSSSVRPHIPSAHHPLQTNNLSPCNPTALTVSLLILHCLHNLPVKFSHKHETYFSCDRGWPPYGAYGCSEGCKSINKWYGRRLVVNSFCVHGMCKHMFARAHTQHTCVHAHTHTYTLTCRRMRELRAHTTHILRQGHCGVSNNPCQASKG